MSRPTLHLPEKVEKPAEQPLPTIKLATFDDVVKLVVYGDQFWRQTRYFAAGVDYHTETVIDRTNDLIDEGVVLYAENEEGAVVALMLIAIAPLPMNYHHLTACEWVFYVDPKYRRGGVGAKLIETAEHLLKERHVKFFTMVSLANVTPDAANDLYETLGFERSETNYTKDLSWQQ